MLLTGHREIYFPADRLVLLLCFVSLWYLTAATSPGFCDKDGCVGIVDKGILSAVNRL